MIRAHVALASDMLGGVWNPFITLKLAVVHDTDIFDASNFLTIENTQSVLTLVGGVVVWNNGLL